MTRSLAERRAIVLPSYSRVSVSGVSLTNRHPSKPLRHRVVYDCVTCGACCYKPNDNRDLAYIEIESHDRILRKPELVRRLVVLDDNLVPHMRLNHNHRCVALTGRLGEKVGCTIYHDRPDTCRRFTAGSKKCKELRKERRID